MLKCFAVRLSQWRALTPDSRGVLLAAAGLLPVFWIALRVLGLARFHSMLSRRPLRASTMLVPDAFAVAEQVNRAARHSFLPATCLTRSLLLGWLLRRQGISSELRIGVRMADGQFQAHAWLECGGVPVNDTMGAIREFAVFDQPSCAASFRFS